MQEHFIEALEAYVLNRLQAIGNEADYLSEAVEIVDARNLLFRNIGAHTTDETQNIYCLAELCRPDEDTMIYIPNRGRIIALARNYFSSYD